MGYGGHAHTHGHNHAHGSHEHSHGESKKFLGLCVCTDFLRLCCMLCMTFTFFLIELVVGQISHSIALTADAFHMLSDAIALIIGLSTVLLVKRNKKSGNTYGWVRAEVLGPLINSVFLISLCFGIFIDAIERLFEPQIINDIDSLLIVGLIGLFINIFGMFVFGHAHSHGLPNETNEEDDEDNSSEIVELIENDKNIITQIGIPEDKKQKKNCCTILSSKANMNIRAVFLHVMADALGSIFVIISALINKYQNELGVPKKAVNFIDPVLCLCLITLILSTAVPLLKESALILLQTVPKEIEIDVLKSELVSKIPDISNVHELHVWKLSGQKIIATAHVTCHNSSEYMQIATDIKKFFHKKGIHSTTIQPEFSDVLDIREEENCLIECKKQCNPNTCCPTQSIQVKDKSVPNQLDNSKCRSGIDKAVTLNIGPNQCITEKEISDT